MGQKILKSLYSFQSYKEKKILMLGIDNAGKTTILNQLKLNKVVESIPSIGYNVEKIAFKNFKLSFWDLPGRDYLRKMFWHHYYNDNNALLFVLDSTDTDRFNEAKETLNMLIENPNMADIPILILANKQDIATMCIERIKEQLELNKYIGIRQLHVQGCCALNGKGLNEGLECLKFTICDFGGFWKLGQLQHHYFQVNNPLIYVLDSTDFERIKEAKQALEMVLESSDMTSIPVLVQSRKQDIAVMNLSKISEKLELNTIKGIGGLYIQGCCALNGEEIYESLDWLSKTLNKQQK